VLDAGVSARAEEPAVPVAFGADQVRFDARDQALDASGRVHVDEPPFHLTSNALKLRRVSIGAELEGEGRLAFCPCLGTPLAVRFRGATVAPPHDLVLRDPVLEVLGVPVAWAPVVWLRSAGRFGVLPPDVTWRGADGLFVGGGVHVPWRNGDVSRGLDLRAGVYVEGGAAAQWAMRTAVSETRVRWDWRGGQGRSNEQGVALDLHGATAIAAAAGEDARDSVAWRVDALRGSRAVKATTDVDAAAFPFDRAEAQASWRTTGWTFASGVRSFAARGGDLSNVGTGGPLLVARTGGAIGHTGSYDAAVEGGAVGGAGLAMGTTSFARGEADVHLSSHLGPVGTTLAVHAFGDVADDGSRVGTAGAAQARLSAGLPMARSFASADEDDPWIHRTEPRLEVGAIAAQDDDVLAKMAGRGLVLPSGTAWLAAASWYNAVGRWGSRASAEVDGAIGAIGTVTTTGTAGDAGNARRALPLLRVRGAAGGHWLGLNLDFARVLASSPDASRWASPGGALIARARIGPASGLHVSAHVAERDGVDPLVARALVEPPLEPANGFLAVSGWTGGALVGLPIGALVTTRAGADVDLEARELVAALGALELHDACRCVVARVAAAHRIGRDGVDVWLSMDLASP
jgi:hypothetical protein